MLSVVSEHVKSQSASLLDEVANKLEAERENPRCDQTESEAICKLRNMADLARREALGNKANDSSKLWHREINV